MTCLIMRLKDVKGVIKTNSLPKVRDGFTASFVKVTCIVPLSKDLFVTVLCRFISTKEGHKGATKGAFIWSVY